MSRDKYPGVGPIGRAFLAFFNPAPSKPSWFGPASSWTQRKAPESKLGDFAPKIIRHHQQWPHESWPGGGQGGPQHQPWPFERWPGGGERR